jgi:Zn-dependent peptidase ImmA (M78 family)/transcriptional regulator with XRE-family HTH domain
VHEDLLSSGTALETVRLDRGLSQAALAKAAGISQAALSKAEADLIALSGERLALVARALRCPIALLTHHDGPSLAPTACVFHRKRASTTVGQAKQARARLALARVHAEALLDLVEPHAPASNLPREAPTDDEYVTPEDIARTVRDALGLDRGPVDNLVQALESTGAVVMTVELGGPRLDALSDWVPGRRPVLLTNRRAPGDRQRFTVAHETGHAVMHDTPGEHAETQADRFAAELLMPAADIRDALDRPTLERLLALKAQWRVSAAALLRRAYTLGLVNDHTYRRLNTEMSAAGWKSSEPAPFPAERPRALTQALHHARLTLDDATIAERTLLLPDQLDTTFGEPATDE